jgi:signal transduction histidine kinase
LAVINDVLDVSRLQGGLLTIQAQPQHAIDLAESAVNLAHAITRTQRRIEIDVPDDLPPLHIDPRRLAQALGNLLANALKFTPENGIVRLAARLQADGRLHLTVEDTGIGMAPETTAQALEPFRQLDGSLARRFEGTGLGLSIAKALTELHGGSLSVKSAVGEGTTVTLALPATRLGARADRTKVA